MPVSIGDVAQRAGVSQSTVSHVLNSNAHARIAPATQERVRRAAAELGYQPNRIARSLGRRRTDTIGLMISGLQNPFYVHLTESAERIATEAGYQVLLDSAPSVLTKGNRAKLRGWPMDGVLMWAEPGQTLAQHLASQADALPVVYLSGQPRPDNADSVYFDVYAGASAAMKHLVDCGYRRVAYMFPHEWVFRQPDEPRYRAYRECCAATGVPLQMILMEQNEETVCAGLEAGLALAAMTTPARPQAVLCFNDVVAMGVLFGLRRAGLRVPEDVAIIGFDGLPESQCLDLPLTTVLLPADEMCREALRILLDRIRGGHSAPAQQVPVAARLLFGGTT